MQWEGDTLRTSDHCDQGEKRFPNMEIRKFAASPRETALNGRNPLSSS